MHEELNRRLARALGVAVCGGGAAWSYDKDDHGIMVCERCGPIPEAESLHGVHNPLPDYCSWAGMAMLYGAMSERRRSVGTQLHPEWEPKHRYSASVQHLSGEGPMSAFGHTLEEALARAVLKFLETPEETTLEAMTEEDARELAAHEAEMEAKGRSSWGQWAEMGATLEKAREEGLIFEADTREQGYGVSLSRRVNGRSISPWEYFRGEGRTLPEAVAKAVAKVVAKVKGGGDGR